MTPWMVIRSGSGVVCTCLQGSSMGATCVSVLRFATLEDALVLTFTARNCEAVRTLEDSRAQLHFVLRLVTRDSVFPWRVSLAHDYFVSHQWFFVDSGLMVEISRTSLFLESPCSGK